MKLRLDNGPLLAGLFTLVLLVWMGSGFFKQDAHAGASTADAGNRTLERGRVRVQVRSQEASEIDHVVVLHGKTAPDRGVSLRAEIAGRVVAVHAHRGEQVLAGEAIIEIDAGDLQARLDYARDLVRQRELEFAGAQRLRKQNHLGEAALAEAQAQLSRARSEARTIAVQLGQTRIVAPFDGLLDDRQVEVGDYVKSGDTIARLLDFKPALLVGYLSEAEGLQVTNGMQGLASLRDDRQYKGHVRYISAEADAATRSYRVEFALDTTQTAITTAGITARAEIHLKQVLAHRVSPALLTLNAQGHLGVKIVDDQERARFMPITLVRAGADGAWVSGLPASVRIITVGAGFVNDQDPVEAVAETRASTADAT